MGQLSKDRVDRMRDVSYKYFDWNTVLRDAGITEIQDLDDQLLLKCPMHPDKRPSFRVRLREHDCHCFSCGFWGRVIDLMYELSGKHVSKSQYYEQVLKRSPGMQQELGFSSLFIDAYTLDPGFQSRRKFSPKDHIGSGMPLSVFTKRVQGLGLTWENLVYSLSLMQEGESLENIYARMAKIQEIEKAQGQERKQISLMSLVDD